MSARKAAAKAAPQTKTKAKRKSPAGKRPARTVAGPLAGIRVLDISAVVAGPYASKLLADFGAEVIRVEPREGDLIRWIAGKSPTPGMSGKYLHLNRNKRSIVLDLKHPRGREALLKLAATADVFMHNMREPAIGRLKLGYRELARANPRIVYLSIAGFGSGGRYAGKPAYDSIIQGASGMASLFERTTGAPRYVPMVIADRFIGMAASHALLVALLRRERTGRGARIELPMFETLAGLVLAEHSYESTFDPPLGPPGDLRLIDPNARPVQTADGFICITTNTDAQAFALLEAIGRPELKDDPRFSTKFARAKNAGALFALRAEALAQRTTAHWMRELEARDIPVARYHTLQTLASDPHLRDAGLLERVVHPSEGPMWTIRDGARIDGRSAGVRRPAPRVGADTVAVLREAGLSAAQVRELLAAGACWDGGTGTPAKPSRPGNTNPGGRKPD